MFYRNKEHSEVCCCSNCNLADLTSITIIMVGIPAIIMLLVFGIIGVTSGNILGALGIVSAVLLFTLWVAAIIDTVR